MSDFTAITEINGTFTGVESSDTVAFTPTGDQGQIIVTNTTGWGDNYGDDWGGGTQTLVISGATTSWTDIDEP